MPKYKVDSKIYLQKFIEDMKENNCTIKAFVGDNLKRAEAKECLNHASSFPCEYCFCKATSYSVNKQEILQKKRSLEEQQHIIENRIMRIQENEEHDQEEAQTLQLVLSNIKSSISNIKLNKTKLVWPSSTINGEARTKEKICEIVRKIEDDPNLSKEEKKGIVGRSPLLDLDYFDIVLDAPTEYLHSVCLGVVKRLVCLTFNVGIVRPRITKRKLTPVSKFNLLMLEIKVPREFSRRARNLDFSVLKGQEFRNIVLFFFILVVECIEEGEPERKIWLLLGYVIRACVIPNNEFQNFQHEDIKKYSNQFYKLYEKTFGVVNCSYNTHVVGSHLIEMRFHGPLTLTSAFGFEHFYGEIRHCFVPGTISPLKQIMQKVFLKRALSTHECTPTTHITNHNTELECNDLIYTFVHRTYHCYKVVDINNDVFDCLEINTTEVFYEEVPNLNWDTVGVFKEESMGTEKIRINQRFVAGKLVKIKDILLTCPMNILNEK